MATKKISSVNTVNSLNKIYGRQSGDIVQCNAENVTVGGIIASDFIKSNIYITQDSGVNRCSIPGGGYMIAGDFVFISMQIKMNAADVSANRWYTLMQFPSTVLPRHPYTPLNIECINFSSAKTNHICGAVIKDNGELLVYASDGLPANTYYQISGWYVI